LKNLKRLRAAAGITQEALAERASCSPTMIANVETGKRFPSPELLDRLSGAFGVPVSELFKPDSAAIAWTRDNANVRERLNQEIGAVIDSVLRESGMDDREGRQVED
jgi:transcriptional regulator with XRE-family HTH domain